MANKLNPFWDKVRALEPGQSWSTKVLGGKRQADAWRTYVSSQLNRKRPVKILTSYDAATETFEFRCVVVKVSDMFDKKGLDAYTDACAGAYITQEQYETIKTQMQAFLHRIKPLIL